MRVLFAASEIFPYAKTGGLADVAASLPKALQKYVDIVSVMPLYKSVSIEDLELYDNFTVSLDGNHYDIRVLQTHNMGMITYFIEAEYLSDTEELYGDLKGDYENNALRFGIFCMAIIELALRLNISHLHLNDWHTALAALFIKQHNLQIKVLFTIHNLAYQGIFSRDILELLGIEERFFTMDLLEFYGKVNFLKAGIGLSDAVTTVSQNYAREILTPQYGCGLDGFLKVHEKKLFGILNGIDYSVYPPLEKLQQKKEQKTALTQEFHLKNISRPLFVLISRLVEQKGIDLLLASCSEILEEKCNLFILGEGEQKYTLELQKLAQKYENFHFIQGYDESLSRRVYAAADFLLMPSSFEPCGLNQFIAMNSGVIPVVHSVGGLKESVYEREKKCGRGITYSTQNTKEFLYAFQRALTLYSEKKRVREIQKFNLTCDFSFDTSAKKYFALYKELV